MKLSYKLLRTMKKTLITALFQIATKNNLVNMMNLLRKLSKIHREKLRKFKQKT